MSVITLGKRMLGLSKKEYAVLMLGLDGAGKTCILQQLLHPRPGILTPTIPTVGFDVETVRILPTADITVWGGGGQEKIRPLWRRYLWNGVGFIFVVDASDRARFQEAKEALDYLILEREYVGKHPLVVLGNKRDISGAADYQELWNALDMDDLSRKHSQCTLMLCSALLGTALKEPLEWIDARVTPTMIFAQENLQKTMNAY